MQTMHKAGHVKPNVIPLTPQGHSAPQLYNNTERDMTSLKTSSCKNVHFAKAHRFLLSMQAQQYSWVCACKLLLTQSSSTCWIYVSSTGSKALCCATLDNNIQKCLKGVIRNFHWVRVTYVGTNKLLDMIESSSLHRSCSELPCHSHIQMYISPLQASPTDMRYLKGVASWQHTLHI